MKIKNNSILNDKRLLSLYVAESCTYTDVLGKFKLQVTGGNLRTLKKYISIFEISISHFNPKAYLLSRPRVNVISDEDLFCVNSKSGTETARRRILKNKLIPYKCVECGIEDKWNNKDITLQLEHKNGNNKDHRLENLEFLCPNCHSQTSTYGGKNKKQYRISSEKKSPTNYMYLESNLKKIVSEIKNKKFVSLDGILKEYNLTVTTKKRSYLRKRLQSLNNNELNDFLNLNNWKKIEYPAPEKLLEMVRSSNYLQVSKQLGCSDNAIRKYLRKSGLI